MLEEQTREAEAHFLGESVLSPDATPSSKYNFHANEVQGAVLGDHLQVTNNYGLSLLETKQLLQDFITTYVDERTKGFSHSSPYTNTPTQSFADTIRQEVQDAELANEPRQDYIQENQGNEQVPSDIDEWYYSLDAYERSFVIATILLHGSPLVVVSATARELCGETLQERSSTKLRKRTFTVAVLGSGGMRLFWQNAEFGSHVLRFIAEESLEWSGTQPDEGYLDMLQRLAGALTGENARRATRAIGAIMSYQNPNLLWKTANAFVESEDVHQQHLASQLLFGAYEIGCSQSETRSGRIICNSIQGLLNQWTERFLATSNISMGRATVQTYSLLGSRFPEMALQGLENLLQPSQNRNLDSKNAVPKAFTSAVTSAYLALSWSGQIRRVLASLALHAERLSHQHSHKVKDYQRYKKYRETVLNITLDTFSLIAASSLTIVPQTLTGCYNVHTSLPEHPTLSDNNDRDILLAGLLSHNECDWHYALSALLCAMLIEKRYKVTFDLLHHWAETVVNQQDKDANELQESFVSFMISLDNMLNVWCRDLQDRSISRQAVQVYRDKLTEWQNNQATQPYLLCILAHNILLRLNR